MHEKSLVKSLLTQVEQLRVDNHATYVDRVTVEVGPLSGVEPELIRSAFDEVASEQFEVAPVLDIRLIQLQIRCRSCLHEASVEGLTLQCPECKSSKVQVIRGDEFRLIDVSIQVHV